MEGAGGMNTFPLKIVSPDGMEYEGQVEELVVRTTTGDLGILAGHIDCVAPLGMGQAMIVENGRKLALCAMAEALSYFEAAQNGSGGLRIAYDDAKKTITVDRSGMEKRFNVEQGEERVRPLPKGLSHLRIFIDRSSVEIFVNDGDAVFSSRIFPTAEENRLIAIGDASVHLWELKRAVTDDFKVE